VSSEGSTCSGVNGLRPGLIVTNAAAYEGTEVQYQRKRRRRLFASVGSEEVKFVYFDGGIGGIATSLLNKYIEER
jgi:hypothetical protein